jgi:hypothetical protein
MKRRLINLFLLIIYAALSLLEVQVAIRWGGPWVTERDLGRTILCISFINLTPVIISFVGVLLAPEPSDNRTALDVFNSIYTYVILCCGCLLLFHIFLGMSVKP